MFCCVYIITYVYLVICQASHRLLLPSSHQKQCCSKPHSFRLFWNVPKGNWSTVKHVFIFCKGSYCARCSGIILYKVISRGQQSGYCTALSMFVIILDKRHETALYCGFYFIFQMTSDIKHLFVHLTFIYLLWRICVCLWGYMYVYVYTKRLDTNMGCLPPDLWAYPFG